MADVQIEILNDGPYKVRGSLALVDADGTQHELERDTVFLCRCGGSTNKPFCDGTHSKIGFQGARRAVEAAD